MRKRGLLFLMEVVSRERMGIVVRAFQQQRRNFTRGRRKGGRRKSDLPRWPL